MRQWFGVSANAALDTRWTQFINHANYKITDSNVMDWANVTKIHTPPICQTLITPLRSMRCTKIISRPIMANYRKSLLTWRPLLKTAMTAAPLLLAPGGVLPYKGLIGTCGQPGYVFRDFCVKQGIEFIIFCLNQGIDFSIFVLNRISFLGR